MCPHECGPRRHEVADCLGPVWAHALVRNAILHLSEPIQFEGRHDRGWLRRRRHVQGSGYGGSTTKRRRRSWLRPRRVRKHLLKLCICLAKLEDLLDDFARRRPPSLRRRRVLRQPKGRNVFPRRMRRGSSRKNRWRSYRMKRDGGNEWLRGWVVRYWTKEVFVYRRLALNRVHPTGGSTRGHRAPTQLSTCPF